MIFDRSKIRFDRSKVLRLIQHQLSTDRNKQRLIANLNRNFDRSKNKSDQSKLWKNKIFEKHSIFTQKLLKALNYIKHMHEYEMKCVSKTHFKPSSPKIKIFNPFSLDSQTSNMFCIKLNEFFKLGWSNQKHTQ